MQNPSVEQLSALQEFATITGRCWKAELGACWRTGKYPTTISINCSSYLQQVRNQFGHGWLIKFKIS